MATTSVRKYRRRQNGRLVNVRRHARTVAYGPGRKNGRRGRGLFQTRRALRHMTGRNSKGRRLKRWSKRRTAGVVLLGVAEMLAFVVFRSLGLVFVVAALGLSALTILTNSTTKQPARRRSPGRGATTRSRGSSSKKKKSKLRTQTVRTTKGVRDSKGKTAREKKKEGGRVL